MAPYAIFFAIVMIVFGGVFIIALTEVVNTLIGVVNPYITAGDVSTQFVTYWNFALGLLEASPILLIFAISAWAYVRAIERDGGRSASSPASLFGGIAGAFIGIFLSILFFIKFGIPAELMVSGFVDSNAYDISAPWSMGYSDTVLWLNLLYVIIILPAILGVVVMFLSAIRTQDYDVIGSSEGQSGYGSTSPQYVSAEEFRYMRGLR